MAFTFQGIGTTFYGQRGFRADGSYITTEWIVLCYIPVVPMRSLRVLAKGSESLGALYHKQNYAVLEERQLSWKQVLCTYFYVVSYLFWCIGLFLCVGRIEPFLQRSFARQTSEYLFAAVVLFGLAAPAVVPFIVRWQARKHARA